MPTIWDKTVQYNTTKHKNWNLHFCCAFCQTHWYCISSPYCWKVSQLHSVWMSRNDPFNILNLHYATVFFCLCLAQALHWARCGTWSSLHTLVRESVIHVDNRFICNFAIARVVLTLTLIHTFLLYDFVAHQRYWKCSSSFQIVYLPLNIS